MDPTSSATGPVYTYSPSERQNKASGPSIQNYIQANQPGYNSNQAIAAADEAARASSTVQGMSIADYVAANRGAFSFTPANLSAGESIAQYEADAGVSSTTSSASTAAAASAAALVGVPSSATTQGMTFQDYLNNEQASASSAASSAAASATSAANAGIQQVTSSTGQTGMTIQQYFAATQGSSTP